MRRLFFRDEGHHVLSSPRGNAAKVSFRENVLLLDVIALHKGFDMTDSWHMDAYA